MKKIIQCHIKIKEDLSIPKMLIIIHSENMKNSTIFFIQKKGMNKLRENKHSFIGLKKKISRK